MALMKKKSRVSDEIPTSSMADIAFLLLIFFLVTTVFEEEKGLPIVLPEKAEDVEVSQKNVLHLVVRPDGMVEIKRGESPQIQVESADRIAGIWRDEVAKNELLIAAVKTDLDAPFKYMVSVLDQLQNAGAQRISLQPLEN